MCVGLKGVKEFLKFILNNLKSTLSCFESVSFCSRSDVYKKRIGWLELEFLDSFDSGSMLVCIIWNKG
jgi:hypothetical protein